MTEHAVVIVGGGPTGLMLAGELALAGVDVAIVERRHDNSLAGSRAGGLHPRALEVLDQRGIAERFVSQGQKHPLVHFHVPLYREVLGAFSTTQAFLARVLERQRGAAVSAELEVETYTWDVLPPEQRTVGVDASIARELGWVLERLAP